MGVKDCFQWLRLGVDPGYPVGGGQSHQVTFKVDLNILKTFLKDALTSKKNLLGSSSGDLFRHIGH